FARDARSVEYEAFGWFHPVWALGWFSLAAACGFARADSGGKSRAVALFVLGALCLSTLAPQLSRALVHLAREDWVLENVVESQPLWRSPRWAMELLGPLVVLGPLGAY